LETREILHPYPPSGYGLDYASSQNPNFWMHSQSAAKEKPPIPNILLDLPDRSIKERRQNSPKNNSYY